MRASRLSIADCFLYTEYSKLFLYSQQTWFSSAIFVDLQKQEPTSVDYWLRFRFRRGTSPLRSVLSEPPKLRTSKFGNRKSEIALYCVVRKRRILIS